MFAGNTFAATNTNLLNENLINVKIELENLYYKTSSGHKLTSKEKSRLAEIKTALDAKKRDNNTNVVPIYYKLGNVYKSAGMKDEAKLCYYTIVKYYRYSPLAKKSLVNLKYMGGTYQNEYNRTRVLPIPEEDEKDAMQESSVRN